MKAYTDFEQSKKLAEILPIKSADMPYYYVKDDKDNDVEIPCWSLAALIEVISYPTLSQEYDGKWSCMEFPENEEVKGYETPIDACYEMIIKLNELKLL